MGIYVLFIDIMAVVCGHERDGKLLAHPHQPLIHRLLHGNAVILQLQEKISGAEYILIIERRLTRLLIHASGQIPLHLAAQAGAKGNDALAVGPENLVIHPGLIIKAFYKPL